MPLYFAYGSNMDAAGLRRRCPKARALGLARLARHRFVLMRNGFASVRRDPVADVHGVLFDLALSDIRPLDRYEEIDTGLYTKVVHPVLRHQGRPVQALLYIGNDPIETDGNGPIGHGLGHGTVDRSYAADPSYMEGVVAAAKAVALPPAYVGMLASLAAHRSGAPMGGRRPALP